MRMEAEVVWVRASTTPTSRWYRQRAWRRRCWTWTTTCGCASECLPSSSSAVDSPSTSQHIETICCFPIAGSLLMSSKWSILCPVLWNIKPFRQRLRAIEIFRFLCYLLLYQKCIFWIFENYCKHIVYDILHTALWTYVTERAQLKPDSTQKRAHIRHFPALRRVSYRFATVVSLHNLTPIIQNVINCLSIHKLFSCFVC